MSAERREVRPRFYGADDEAEVYALRKAGRVWREVDLLAEQVAELTEARAVAGRPPAVDDPGTWVYYPWSGVLVRMLSAGPFRELRLDRNRHKITAEEQAVLAARSVGVVGLSVGNAVAVTLAQEGVAGRLVLADFDVLGSSNLNRVRAPVSWVGLPKTLVAARQVAEIDPYVDVRCFDDGLTPDNLDAFLDGLDVVVDECDGLAMKLQLRRAARARQLPVVMETSDRGTLDVERFDHEPERPLLHGRVPELAPEVVAAMSKGERLGLVARIVGYDVSTRAAASMLEIGATVSTWPQLASDVAHGGATVCAAVRRILLGQPLASGRRHIDLAAALEAVEPRRVAPTPPPRPEAGPLAATIPAVHRHVVAAAIQAPSGGNCQPWRFVSAGDGLQVHHLRERSESLLDADGYAGLLSVAMATEAAVLAASGQGHRAEVRPTGEASGHVLTLSLVDDPSACPHPLLPWIGRRFTDRRNPERAELPADVGARLAAELPVGVRVELVTSDDGRAELGRWIGEVDRVRFLHPGLGPQMWDEVRWDAADAAARPDGISLAEMHVQPGDEAILRLLSRPDVAAFLRRMGGGKRLADLAQDWTRSATAVGLVSADATDPASLIAAGRGIYRMWLRACAEGFAVQPIGVAAYMIRHLGTELEGGYRPEGVATLRGADDALTRHFPGAARDRRLLLFRLLRGGERYAPQARLPLADVLTVT